MDRHWDCYATMSIVHFMAYPAVMSGDGDIAEAVADIVRDPFFGGIELTRINDVSVRSEVRRIAREGHLPIRYCANPVLVSSHLDPNSLDETLRRATVSELKTTIDEAVELGASRFTFMSGRDPKPTDRPAALDALIRSTRELCEYGHERGVGLTCETFDQDVDKKALIGPSETAVHYATAVRRDYPDFGLLYDLSHQPLLREESQAALELLGDLVVHVHIGNCVIDPALNGYGDVHPYFGWPGSVVDVPEVVTFIRALFRVGYLAEDKPNRPWVSFEVRPQPGETTANVIAGAKRVWQEAWAKA
jgi:sugar phosphate isomerase/epimerase